MANRSRPEPSSRHQTGCRLSRLEGERRRPPEPAIRWRARTRDCCLETRPCKALALTVPSIGRQGDGRGPALKRRHRSCRPIGGTPARTRPLKEAGRVPTNDSERIRRSRPTACGGTASSLRSPIAAVWGDRTDRMLGVAAVCSLRSPSARRSRVRHRPRCRDSARWTRASSARAATAQREDSSCDDR